jgi:hypothetical protein
LKYENKPLWLAFDWCLGALVPLERLVFAYSYDADQVSSILAIPTEQKVFNAESPNQVKFLDFKYPGISPRLFFLLTHL